MDIATRFKIFFFVNYMGYAVFIPYLGLYLAGKGFTGSQLAFLLGVIPLTKIFVQPLWGMVSDIFQIRGKVLSFSLFALGLAAIPVALVDHFYVMLLFVILFSILEAPYLPLGTALALDYLAGEQRLDEFGPIRLYGSVGFIIAAFLMGLLFVDSLITYLPYVFLGVMVLTSLISLSLPDRSNGRPQNWIEGFGLVPKFPRLALFLGGLVFVGATLGIYSQYLAVYMDEINSPGWIIGLAIGLQAISEIPLMARTPQLVNRFGMHFALMVGILVLPVRWLLFAVIQEPWLVLPVQILHGFTILSIGVVGVTFVNQQLPEEWRATGQGLHATAFGGIGMSAGLFLAGYIYNGPGIQAVWLACVLISLGAIFLVQRSLAYSIPGEGHVKVE